MTYPFYKVGEKVVRTIKEARELEKEQGLTLEEFFNEDPTSDNLSKSLEDIQKGNVFVGSYGLNTRPITYSDNEVRRMCLKRREWIKENDPTEKARLAEELMKMNGGRVPEEPVEECV